MAFNINRLPYKKKDVEETKTFVYEGRDILTNEVLLEREYSIPPAQTAEEVIGYYARRIAQDVKLPSQFSVLAPKIKDFFERKAFGETVDLADVNVIRAMSSNVASYVVINTFVKALREVIVEERIPELLSISRFLSETPPFPTSKKVRQSPKTVFNYIPCDNKFEDAFIVFLDQAEDVTTFAKLPTQFGFSINYTDSLANIRNYFPDFVAITDDGIKWVIETKGREDIDVRMKDVAAENWCENATELTGESWQYIKVGQKDFDTLHPDSFGEMIAAITPASLFIRNSN